MKQTESPEESIQKAFGRKKTIKSTGIMLYPYSAERELVRLMWAQLKIVRDVYNKYLPEIERIYNENRLNTDGVRYDTKILQFSERFSRTIRKMEKEIAKRVEDFDTETFMKKVAQRAKSNNIREWKRLIKRTFGIDLDGNYYNKGTYNFMIDSWVADNVKSIKGLTEEQWPTMKNIIMEGYFNGDSITKIKNQIVKQFGKDKRHARQIAVDQVGSLNAQITRYQQQKAGCDKYWWCAVMDNRTRESHAFFHGKIYSWDAPPMGWYRTKHGIVYTRACHPGEDYGCRCVAMPVFEVNSVMIPIEQQKHPKIMPLKKKTTKKK